MGDLCTCWDVENKVVILQHNEIKASFTMSLHVVSLTFNVTLYKHLIGYVSKYALVHIAEEFLKVQTTGFDSSHCGCVIRRTHGLPCACELARYHLGLIPLTEVHVMWTKLSFSYISCSESRSELCIQQDIDIIVARFKDVDIAGKVAIKSKLHEIAYPDMTSMCPPVDKVKTKGSQKEKAKWFALSTKRDPSYFEHVDKIHSVHDSNCNSKTQLLTNPVKSLIKTNEIQMLDQFHLACHPYIIGVIDVKADGHCVYQAIVALLGMGEES